MADKNYTPDIADWDTIYEGVRVPPKGAAGTNRYALGATDDGWMDGSGFNAWSGLATGEQEFRKFTAMSNDNTEEFTYVSNMVRVPKITKASHLTAYPTMEMRSIDMSLKFITDTHVTYILTVGIAKKVPYALPFRMTAQGITSGIILRYYGMAGSVAMYSGEKTLPYSASNSIRCTAVTRYSHHPIHNPISLTKDVPVARGTSAHEDIGNRKLPAKAKHHFIEVTLDNPPGGGASPVVIQSNAIYAYVSSDLAGADDVAQEEDDGTLDIYPEIRGTTLAIGLETKKFNVTGAKRIVTISMPYGFNYSGTMGSINYVYRASFIQDFMYNGYGTKLPILLDLKSRTTDNDSIGIFSGILTPFARRNAALIHTAIDSGDYGTPLFVDVNSLYTRIKGLGVLSTGTTLRVEVCIPTEADGTPLEFGDASATFAVSKSLSVKIPTRNVFNELNVNYAMSADPSTGDYTVHAELDMRGSSLTTLRLRMYIFTSSRVENTIAIDFKQTSMSEAAADIKIPNETMVTLFGNGDKAQEKFNLNFLVVGNADSDLPMYISALNRLVTNPKASSSGEILGSLTPSRPIGETDYPGRNHTDSVVATGLDTHYPSGRGNITFPSVSPAPMPDEMTENSDEYPEVPIVTYVNPTPNPHNPNITERRLQVFDELYLAHQVAFVNGDIIVVGGLARKFHGIDFRAFLVDLDFLINTEVSLAYEVAKSFDEEYKIKTWADGAISMTGNIKGVQVELLRKVAAIYEGIEFEIIPYGEASIWVPTLLGMYKLAINSFKYTDFDDAKDKYRMTLIHYAQVTIVPDEVRDDVMDIIG